MMAVVLLPVAGQTQEMLARASDKQVKALVKSITSAEAKFEGALDSQFKRSILRGPGIEVKVGDYLTDPTEATKNLEKRFAGSHAASAEATEVLQRSSLMHGYVRKNPSSKGANEWDAVAALLQQLATAYGSTFPLPEDAAIRRIGDREPAEPGKAGEKDLNFISKSSTTLASRIRSGKPASAEARQLMEAVARVQALVDMEGIPEKVAAECAAVARPVAKISQSFGLAPPE